jgi:hypothetical protein
LLVYDLYPEILKIKFRKDPFYLISLWSFLNKHIFQSAKIVFTIGEGMKNAISNYTNTDKIHVINNWSSIDDCISLDTLSNEVYIEKYKFLFHKIIFVYAGNMGETHDFTGIKTLITYYGGRKDICFLFIGNGAKKNELEQFKISNCLENIYFLNRLHNIEFQYVMSLCHFGIVALDERMANFSVPSKTFSYLGFKLPLLNFSTISSEVFTIIEKYQIGINFDNNLFLEKKNQLDNLIRDKNAYNKLKNNAFVVSKDLFSKSNAKTYLKIINSHSYI